MVPAQQDAPAQQSFFHFLVHRASLRRAANSPSCRTAIIIATTLPGQKLFALLIGSVGSGIAGNHWQQELNPIVGRSKSPLVRIKVRSRFFDFRYRKTFRNQNC